MDDDEQVSSPEPDPPVVFAAPGLPSAPEDGWTATGKADLLASGGASAGTVPPDADQSGIDQSGAQPFGAFDEQAAAAAAQMAAGPTMRGPMSLISMGIVLGLLALLGWWAQDVIGTVSNAGEAGMGREVTFQSDGGSYRLLSSGPLRPDPNSTWCDITESDGDTRREVGGQGLQTSRLGVDRLLTFHPPAGETTVSCSFRATGPGSGRFQVIDTSSPAALIPAGLFVAAMVSLLIGVLWGLAVFRRVTHPSPAN